MNHIKKRHLDDTQSASKRRYNQISLEKRISLLKDILINRMPINDVATKHEIKLSTVKVIFKLYRKEGRIGKVDVPQLTKTQSEEIAKQPEQSQRTVAEPINEEEQRYYQICMFLSQQLEHIRRVNLSLQQRLIFPYNQFQCQNI